MKWGSWVALVAVAASLGACGDSSTASDEDFTEAQSALTKGIAGAKVGDSDYCGTTPTSLCGMGEGDCDSSAQCQAGLTCVAGNLAKRGALTGDACAPSHCGNGLKDADETSIDCGGTCGTDCVVTCDKSNGDSSRCSTDCPCSVGEGDCDSAAECQPGLVCGTTNGAAFGLPAGTDACWGGSCQNATRDGDETAVDCGGSCAPCAPPAAGDVSVAANHAALIPIVIPVNASAEVVTIANELKAKLDVIIGPATSPFQIAYSNTPSGISLGVQGDFPNAGWPYQGFFRPTDVLAGGILQPSRLAQQERYVLRTPAASSRVIVAGATVTALRHAVWDLLKRIGYRHYFQTPTWEVVPSAPSLVVNLAVDEKPAFLQRTLAVTGNLWESAFVTASSSQVNEWLKHNRMGGSATLAATAAYGKVVQYWEQRHGVAFPGALSTDPSQNYSNRQFCLSGVATVGGQQVTVLDAVREWAQAQTTATLSLSPNAGVNWASAITNGSLNCNDINDPVYGSVANRLAAIFNAAAEVQPTKLIAATVQYDFAEAPTLSLRQNVFVNVRSTYASLNPTTLESLVKNWSASSFETGIEDYFGVSNAEVPGQRGGVDHSQDVVVLSASSLVDRVSRFYQVGGRRYAADINWGWGQSGPAWWALAQALWDADERPSGASYRADFLTRAFGAAAPEMDTYYSVIENRPLWSENLIGVMYRALKRGFELTELDPAVQARLSDLAVYTRYLELNRKMWNRCSTSGGGTEQAELKEVLQFAYATRDRRILEARDAMAGVVDDLATCTSCTANGCVNAQGQLTGAACALPEWGVGCPSATQTAACGSCYGTTPPNTQSCNAMKNGTAPSQTELRTIVANGALSNNVLPSGLTRSFSRDLVPYTPDNPALTRRLDSYYTKQPYNFYLQRPASSGNLGVHVRKFSSSQILAGQLALASQPDMPIDRRVFGGSALETDWDFNVSSSALYRLDLDDRGGRMYTTFPPDTRAAIPVGADDLPLPINYRYGAYFVVPKGTTHVVGWSQADGQFRRHSKTAAGTWPAQPTTGYLSDFAVGHACTSPRVVVDLSLTGALNDHFVIPVSPVPTQDEIWLFTDSGGGAQGDRVLLSTPAYFFRDVNEILVPREIAPESVTPTSCSTNANCPAGQYCTQAGQCRTEGGGCNATSQCEPQQTCQAGQCGCAGDSCSASCKCGGGGICATSADCLGSLSCVEGTCQDCGAVVCGGATCATSDDCAVGLVCANQQCVPRGCVGDGDCPTTNPECSDAVSCPSAMTCPSTLNGWRFGQPGKRICEPANCCTDPAQIGTSTPECGLCVCKPDCSTKTCGAANLDDGCGRRCLAVCAPGSTGCQQDSDCTAGNICRAGKCVAGDVCGRPDLAPPNCGPGTVCGPCPPTVGAACDDRQCGADPVTGASCGTCGAQQFCNAAGRCAEGDHTPPIEVPTLDGTRPVVPDPAPKPPLLVGATQGTFAVTDRGSASYSIPVEVPPGRVGIEPSLSIRYTSTTGNGALGIGWSIDGFSSIARCPRTYAQDGYARPVTGDAGDAFCLDGQRLVETSTNEYYTQVETFSKVVAIGATANGPQSFKVYAKDGRILIYGATSNSRNVLRGSVVGSWALNREQDRVGNFLRIVYEQTSSEITASYEVSTSEMVPKAITYTGFGSVDGDREVRFNYDTARGDVIAGFRPGGGAFARSRILRSIDVRASNQLVRRYSLTYEEAINKVQRLTAIQECAGASGIFCHRPTLLNYYDEQGFDEGHDRIVPNEEGRSLPPAIFPSGMVHKSSDGRDVLTVLTSYSTPYYTTPIPLGASTAVSLVPIGGPVASGVINLINVLGVQKREDLLDVSYTFDMVASHTLVGAFACGGDAVPLRQLVGNGSFGAETIRDTCPETRNIKDPGAVQSSFGYTKVRFPARQWLVDLDADGVQDLLYCAEDPVLPDDFGPMHLDWKLARAAGTGNPQPPLATPHAQRDGEIALHGDICDRRAKQQFSTVIDLDNDGTGNLLAFDSTEGWAALIPEGAGFRWRTDVVEGLHIEANYHYYVAAIDANGDGLRDLLALPLVSAFPTPTGEALIPQVAFNTGRGFRQQPLAPYKDGTILAGGTNPTYGAYVLDIDQDGIEELVFADPDEPYEGVMPSSGIARSWRVGRVRNNRFINEAIPSLVEGPGVLGDFDGDGDIDAFTRAVTWSTGEEGNKATPQAFRFHSGKGRKQNLLRSVTDGAGHQTLVDYNGSNGLGPVYKKGVTSGTCSWPQRCVARTDHALVSGHTEAHFETQARLVAQVDRVFSYQYEGARLDTAGYGWLGFSRRTIQITDSGDDFLGGTTIDYEEPEPWVVGTSTAPYLYLRAGLQHSTRETAPVASSAISSSNNHRTETFRNFEYTERTSASGRPFIFLSRTEVNTTDSDLSTAIPMVQEVGTTDVDGYGNAIDELTTRTDYAYSLGISSLASSSATVDRRVSDFTPTASELESWLISLPKSRTVSSTPRCFSAAECAATRRERTTTFTYYPDTGLSHVTTRDSADLSLRLVSEVVRDDRGNATQVTSTDANGDTRVSRTTFDQRRLFPVTSSVVGDGTEQVTQLRFDDRFGKLVSRADPNGIDETWSYDDFGVSRIHTGPGGSETFKYEEADYQELSDGFEVPASLKVTATKLGGRSSETEINSFGQVVRRKSSGFNGANVFEEFGYDSRQRLIVQRRPHLAGDASQGEVHYGYDELDRVITEDYPDGTQVRHDYANAASLAASLSGWRIGGDQMFVQTTDPKGYKTLSIYDRDGQVIGVVDAKNELTTYKYAAFGQLRRIVDPFERMIDFEHDDYGRLKSVTDKAHGGTETTSYNAFDQPVFSADAAGRLRQMHYDGFGRIESQDDNDGTTTWLYDGAGDNEIGRPVEITSSTGQTQTFHYEPRQNGFNRGLLDRSTSELYRLDAPAAPRNLTTKFHYDAYSRLEQIDYPASSGAPLSVKYSFDSYGHTLKAFNAANESQVYWQVVSADQGYRVGEERLGTHACGSSQGTITTRTYEELTGRQRTIKTQCGSLVLQDLRYGYDSSGNLSSRFDAKANVADNFRHDELNRLTEYSPGNGVPFVPRYRYQVSGVEQRRMTWQSDVGDYAYETSKGRDWIRSAGSTTYEHDDVGNIISRVGPGVPGGSQSIEYTAFNLPKRITGPGTAVDFGYDATGTRVVKQGATSTTFYAGDGYQRIETGAAIDQRFTIYAGGRAVAQVANTDTGGTVSPGTVNYLHDDHLGSLNVISTAAGAIATTRTYTPFGKDSSPAAVSPYGFTGQETDDDLGLINMRGRMYDPSLGQFLSADPIMQQPYGQGLNRFAYVNNSPLNFTDPSGFAAKRTSKSWGGDGQTEGILAGFGMGFAGGIASQLGAGSQAISSGAAAAAAAPAAVGGGVAGEAALQAGAAYGPAAGLASGVSVGVSIAIDHTLGAAQPTQASSAEAPRSGGGRTGGAVGRGATAPDAIAPVQEPMPTASAGQYPGQQRSFTPGRRVHTINPGSYLESTGRGNYRLNAEGRRLLKPIFEKNFGYDPSNITFNFVHGGPAAFTPHEGRVIINADKWATYNLWAQLETLAHEATHSLQYTHINRVEFWLRYRVEFNDPANYDVPIDLWKIKMSELDPVDIRFTLDQIADRVGIEAAAQVPSL